LEYRTSASLKKVNYKKGKAGGQLAWQFKEEASKETAREGGQYKTEIKWAEIESTDGAAQGGG